MSDHPGQETQGEALRELVAKWRKAANAPGMGEYYQGKEHAYDACADELEAILLRAASAALSPSVSGRQLERQAFEAGFQACAKYTDNNGEYDGPTIGELFAEWESDLQDASSRAR